MALKDSFVKEVLPYLMASWCTLTVLLNILFGVLTVHLINKQLTFTPVAHSFTIQFIVIDVICDILVLLPAAVVSVTLSWMLTDLGCQVYGVVTIFVYLVTFSILSLRCFERVVRIRHPDIHRKLFGSHRRLAVLMISVWFVDLLVSGIPLTGWTVISYDYYHSGCYPVLENNLYHLIVVAFLGIGLALILFVVSHVVIYNSVNSQSNQTRIEPIIIRKNEEKEESLPRTSSQNWIHESDSDKSADSESMNRHKKKKWLEMNASHDSNKHTTETDDKYQERSPHNKPKRSGSYLRKQQEENQNDGNEKDEVREKLTKKHTLFSILYSVSTHFGICLFMIIFWMPYFIVAICRTVDSEVFRGYYSVSLCFILLTYTIKPIVHYVRLYRLIKTKRRNRVQWHREIKQEKMNSKHGKVPKMNRRGNGYMSNDEGYSEESSIGFVTDSSDDQRERDRKRHRITKLKLWGKPPSYEKTLETKNENKTSINNEVNNSRKKPGKRNNSQRKKRKGAPMKGLPVLSKRNWHNDVDSESIDGSNSEFGEFVDETVPTAGQEVQKKQDGSIYRDKKNSKKAVEETEKITSDDKQKENKVMKSEDNYDSLSDESQYDANIGGVHIALKTSRSAASIDDHSEFNVRKTGAKQNDYKKDAQNNSKHTDVKEEENGKPSEVKYSNGAKTSSSSANQSDNQTLHSGEFDGNPGVVTTTKHLRQNNNIKNATKTDSSSNNHSQRESSTSKQNSTEMTRRNSDQQTTSQSDVPKFTFNERRMTYEALNSERVYTHHDSNTKEKNFNLNQNHIRASLPDEETYLTNLDSPDSAPVKVLANNEVKRNGMVIRYDNNSSNRKVEQRTNPNQPTEQPQENKSENKTEKNSKREENTDELFLDTEKVKKRNSKTLSQTDEDNNFTGVSLVPQSSHLIKPIVSDFSDGQHKNMSKDEKFAKKDSSNIPNNTNTQTKHQIQNNPNIFKSERDLKRRKSDDDNKGKYSNSELLNKQPNGHGEVDDPDVLVHAKNYSNQSYPNNEMPHQSSSKNSNGNQKRSEKDRAKTHNHSDPCIRLVNENNLLINSDGLPNTHINGYEEYTTNHRDKVKSFNLKCDHNIKSKNELTTSVISKANRNTENRRSSNVDQSFSEKDDQSLSEKNHHPYHINDISKNTHVKQEIDIPPVILNKDHLTTQHFSTELNSAGKMVNYNQSNDQINKRTNKDDSKSKRNETSNTGLPESIVGRSNKAVGMDEVDLGRVFLNRDELPSETVSITLKDIRAPIAPKEDIERMDEKEKQESQISTSATQVNRTPRKPFNIYDPEEAAPVSCRSLDDKSSGNWYKVKSKVTSYITISAKDKFSAIHGDDNPYDRSGGREIPISHIKDDKVWKDKLADVHLM